MNNVIIAKFSKGVYSTTAKVFRYDVGDKLQFVGLDLPDNYRVDFSNSVLGESKTVFCTSDTVEIPPEYFIPGSTIYAWIVLSQENGRYTKYQVNIPISARAKPLDIEPTPAQKDALDEAIEALNDVTEDIQGQIDSALEEAKKSGEFDGTTIWLYDGTPVLPDYTFYKYLMRANANAVVRQFDFILLGSVLYQIISVSEFTCKAVKFADLKGDPGQSPIVSVGKGSQGRVYIRVVGNGINATYYINNVLVVDFALNADSVITEAPGKDAIKWAIDDGCTVIARVRIPSYSGGRLVLTASHSIPLTKWTYPAGSISENPQLWVFEFSGRVDEEYSIRIYSEAGEDGWHFEKTEIDDELTDRQIDQVLGLIENYTGRFLGNFETKAALNAVDLVWTEEFIDDLGPLPEGSMYVSDNDYVIVQDDETQNHECWRYIYAPGLGFTPQYRVNESPMTTAQLAALNSGITSELVQKIWDIDDPNVVVYEFIAESSDLEDPFAGTITIKNGPISPEVYDEVADNDDKIYYAFVSFPWFGLKFRLPLIRVKAGGEYTVKFGCYVANDTYFTLTGNQDYDRWVCSIEHPPVQDISGKLDKNQGTANNGKVLAVGPDGIVTPKAFGSLPAGGNGGQILRKNSPADYDTVWSTETAEVFRFEATPNDPTDIYGSGMDITAGPSASSIADRIYANEYGYFAAQISIAETDTYLLLSLVKWNGINEFIFSADVDDVRISLIGDASNGWVVGVDNTFGEIWESVDGKVDIDQGTSHAGEFLVVGSDGNVTTKTMTAWQGGSY